MQQIYDKHKFSRKTKGPKRPTLQSPENVKLIFVTTCHFDGHIFRTLQLANFLISG